MPTHTWSTVNDWEYCTLTNVKVVGTNIVLDNSETGTILSDIRDSSSRIYNYSEIIPVINVPKGSSALFYVRSGWYPEYYEDSWTDWKLINESEQRMEYTLSLSTNRIVADYNIKSLVNIYYVKDYNFQTLARNLATIYLGNIDETIAETNELYSSLWSGKVDEAIVDFAKVDYDGDIPTQYMMNASFINNIIYLANPLPDDNVVCIIKYVPRYFAYTSERNRYFQFKIELTLDPMYLHTVTNDEFRTSDGDVVNLGQTGPTVSSINVNYVLDFQHEMETSFPNFFRKL